MSYHAFFSYSHADNDAYDNYVKHFCAELSNNFKAEMMNCKKQPFEPQFFMDISKLPANGDLTIELKQAIINSNILIIFLSKNYLNSKWCRLEVEEFRKKFKGQISQALEKTFVIVLDKEAKEPYLQLFPNETPILIELYEADTGNRIDLYLNRGGEAVMDQRVGRFIKKITKTLVDRTMESSPSVSEETNLSSIVLGYVTTDLKPIRDKLAKRLRDDNFELDILTFEDLENSDQFRKKVSKNNIFIQLYSHAKVNLPGCPGGHLAIQQTYLDSSVVRLWWYPAGETGVINPESAHEFVETNKEHLSFLQKIGGERGTLDQFVMQHFGGQKSEESPIIYFESSRTDDSIMTQVKSKINEIWLSRYPQIELTWYPLPWCVMREDVTDSGKVICGCQGIILFYGTKDISSLVDQIRAIDSRLLRANRKPGRAVTKFSQEDEGNTLWLTLYCWGNERLELCGESMRRAEDFVEAIHSAM